MPLKIDNVDLDKPVAPVEPPAQSLIVLLGAFTTELNDRVRSIFNRVSVPVAIGASSLIVTDAGTSGCAPLIAAAVEEQDQAPSGSALTTKLQADQTEASLDQYNQTLATLRNIEAWWRSPTPWEKSRRTNIDLLVDQTEKAMGMETAGWVQQMQSALDKLTEKESGQGQSGK